MAEHPRGRLRRRSGRAAPGQGGGAGVWGRSPVEEQHLPPGVEMGRNGPQHRPGSETPRPLPRSGRRAGRKSLRLTPSPFPLPKRFPSLAPPPLSPLPTRSVGGWEPCVTRAIVSPPTTPRGRDKGRAQRGRRRLRERGRSRSRRWRAGCVMTSRDAVFIYGRLDAISVFRGWKSQLVSIGFPVLRFLNRFSARGFAGLGN